MAENVVDVTTNDGVCALESNGSSAPIVASVNGNVCSVYALAANGKPIATLKVINKETGEEIPVNVSTCTEAVVCAEGKTTQQHLEALYGHANDDGIHLTPEQKAGLETQTGAQQKANAAKNDAIAAASLLAQNAKDTAAADATAKANAARDAAYKYADQTAPDLKVFEESKTRPGCYFRIVDGETEWLNPPMAHGVLYRTTERRDELPVYAMHLCRKIEEFTEIILANANEEKCYHVISVEAACCDSDSVVLPFQDLRSVFGEFAIIGDNVENTPLVLRIGGEGSGEELLTVTVKFIAIEV